MITGQNSDSLTFLEFLQANGTSVRALLCFAVLPFGQCPYLPSGETTGSPADYSHATLRRETGYWLVVVARLEELTNREEQKTHTERKTATNKMDPKIMKSCSSLAKELSHMTN